MRLKVLLAVLGLLVVSALPASAQVAQQQTYGTGTNYSATPYGSYQPPAPTVSSMTSIYNSGASAQPYTGGQSGSGYNPYSATTPYAFNNTGMTSQQADILRAQRNAQATAQNMQYYNSAQGQMPGAQMPMQPMAGSAYQGAAFSQLYNQQPQPVQRRLVYKGKPKLLNEPPRLFNPDQ